MYAKITFMKRLSAISLFSGAGGIDVGFEHAGFNIEWANDLNRAACKTYSLNHPGSIACGPIEDFLDSISQYRGIDLVVGGPPCQGFSVAGKMDPDDLRSQVLWRFFDVVERVQPAVFVCENVKALAELEKWSRVRKRMFQRAVDLGYEFKLFVLKATEYGVPQRRERMFLIGSRLGRRLEDLEFAFTHGRRESAVLREVLAGLGKAGSPTNPRVCNAKITIATNPVLRRSPYAGMLFNGQGRPIDPDGYASTLHASMGGNKTPIIDEEHLHGHKPSWIESYHAHLWNGGSPLGFEDAPDRLRRLTVDEAIRIQTFPSDYKFHGTQSQIFTQIGNAVPCDLAHAVACAARHLLIGDQDEIIRCAAGGSDTQMKLALAG